MIAFEVDGPTHYAPPDFDLGKFEDDLLRQNSHIHQGWQVFRWSDRDTVYASIQSLANRLSDLPADAFHYLVIDEAHHAAPAAWCWRPNKASPTGRSTAPHRPPSSTWGLDQEPRRDRRLRLAVSL